MIGGRENRQKNLKGRKQKSQRPFFRKNKFKTPSPRTIFLKIFPLEKKKFKHFLIGHNKGKKFKATPWKKIEEAFSEKKNFKRPQQEKQFSKGLPKEKKFKKCNLMLAVSPPCDLHV